jgi:hypothetical protein
LADWRTEPPTKPGVYRVVRLNGKDPVDWNRYVCFVKDKKEGNGYTLSRIANGHSLWAGPGGNLDPKDFAWDHDGLELSLEEVRSVRQEFGLRSISNEDLLGKTLDAHSIFLKEQQEYWDSGKSDLNRAEINYTSLKNELERRLKACGFM